MSRYLETTDKAGKYVETIASMDECKWLINEVCCNADCQLCADFPMDECKRCPHFEQEDGVLNEYAEEVNSDEPE